MSRETYTNAPLMNEQPGDPVQAVDDTTNALGAAMDAVFEVALSSNAAAVAVDDLKAARVLKVTDTLTADGTVTIAAALVKLFVLENATSGAYNLTVKVSGQTGVILESDTQGLSIPLRVDGTDVVNVGRPAQSAFSAPPILQSSTLATITADVDDYDAGAAMVSRISGDDAWNITGLANPEDGQWRILLNIGAYDLTLKHEDAGSTAANRFSIPGASDLAVKVNGAAQLLYDGGTARWHILSRPGAGT